MAKYEDENQLLREDLIDVVMDHMRIGKAWNEYLIEAMKSGA